MRLRRGQDRRRLLLLNQGAENQLLELTYKFKDEFSSADVAVADPGPGEWTVVQNDGSFSESGGKLTFTAQATPTNNDLYMATVDNWAREAGLTFFGKVSLTTSSRNLNGFGFTTNPADVGANTNGITWQDATRRLILRDGTNTTIRYTGSDGWNTGEEYSAAIVCKTAGQYFFIWGGKWGNTPVLHWVGYNSTATNVYGYIHNYNQSGTVDDIFVSVLAPFADASFLNDSLTSPSAGATFVHEADGWLVYPVSTMPTTGDEVISFRRQDSNNLWEVRVTTTGAFQLHEKVAGVYTQRATAAGVITAGKRVRVKFEGTTITGYYDNTQAWQYTGATNFQSATAGSVDALEGGTIATLETLPLVASGTHLEYLNALAAGQ